MQIATLFFEKSNAIMPVYVFCVLFNRIMMRFVILRYIFSPCVRVLYVCIHYLLYTSETFYNDNNNYNLTVS